MIQNQVVKIIHTEKITENQQHRIILTSQGLEKWLYFYEGKWIPGQPVALTENDERLLRKLTVEELFSPEAAVIESPPLCELVIKQRCWVQIKQGVYKKGIVVRCMDEKGYTIRSVGKASEIFENVPRGSISLKKPVKSPKRILYLALGKKADVIMWRDEANVTLVKFDGAQKSTPHPIRSLSGEDLWKVLS